MPSPLRTLLRYKRHQWRGAVRDAGLFLTGRREPDLPPHRLRFVGAGDFRAGGESLLRLLVEVGGLDPAARVLDIGCGVGRVAIPLAKFLEPSATYVGMDPVEPAVRWCRRAIGARHAHFRFIHVDVYNAFYNRRGAPAHALAFPYPAGAFTFAFAISVFTHLDPQATRHYLAEARRTVAPGGRLLATFFLLEPSDAERDLVFPHRHDGYALADASVPEAAIAYDRDRIETALQETGWHLLRLERGTWAGRPEGPCYQDTVVAEAVGSVR